MLIECVFKFFKKLIKSVADKFKSPERRIKDAICDLKKEHFIAMQALADVKSIYIDAKNNVVRQKELAGSYEQNAIAAIKEYKAGKISEEESDKQAAKAIKLKLASLKKAEQYSLDAKNIEETANKIEEMVNQIQDVIDNLENELNSLRARHNAALSSKNISLMLSSVGENDIKSIMQGVRAQVSNEESLAIAYEELSRGETSIDHDINKAISTDNSNQIDLFLKELKKEIDGLENNKG